jgi:hypothetical protein
VTLRRWQDGGLPLFHTTGSGAPRPLGAGPAWWARLRRWALRDSIGGGYVTRANG